MKKSILVLVLSIVCLSFISCSNDDDIYIKPIVPEGIYVRNDSNWIDTIRFSKVYDYPISITRINSKGYDENVVLQGEMIRVYPGGSINSAVTYYFNYTGSEYIIYLKNDIYISQTSLKIIDNNTLKWSETIFNKL